MQSDDESPMAELVSRLNIDSAIMHLKRVGFTLVFSYTKHHLTRVGRLKQPEQIFIELNAQGHFAIEFTTDGHMAEYTTIITTWDEWVEFVHLCGCTVPRPNPTPADAASTKELLCRMIG